LTEAFWHRPALEEAEAMAIDSGAPGKRRPISLAKQTSDGAFVIGDRVHARFNAASAPDASGWYPGVVDRVCVSAEGCVTYWVQFDDGDHERNVLAEHVRPAPGARRASIALATDRLLDSGTAEAAKARSKAAGAGGAAVLGAPIDKCRQCLRPDDPEQTLLCDTCDAPFHAYCVGLTAVPDGEWHCAICVERASFVGRRFVKHFATGDFSGKVISVNRFGFRALYEDGDEEDISQVRACARRARSRASRRRAPAGRESALARSLSHARATPCVRREACGACTALARARAYAAHLAARAPPPSLPPPECLEPATHQRTNAPARRLANPPTPLHAPCAPALPLLARRARAVRSPSCSGCSRTRRRPRPHRPRHPTTSASASQARAPSRRRRRRRRRPNCRRRLYSKRPRR
jgi:hypothetical protein